VRRQWKMEENLGDDFVEMSRQLSVARKYRARRKRVSILCLILVMCLQSMTNFLTLQKFESRALVVQPDEVPYWSQLTVDDMSEESDDAGNPNNLIIHKFTWCSQGI